MMLPGIDTGLLFSGPPLISADALRSVSVISGDVVGNASTPNAITIPVTVQAGDVLHLFTWANGSSPVVSTPPGWTAIADLYNNLSSWLSRPQHCYKIATAGDAGAAVGSSGSGWSTCVRMLTVIRGNIPITGVTLVDVEKDGWTSSSAGSPSQLTVTPGGPVPVLVMASYTAVGVINPRYFRTGGVDVKDGEYSWSGTVFGGTHQHYVAYKAFNDGGAALADCLIDMDDEGTNMFLFGFSMRFTAS